MVAFSKLDRKVALVLAGWNNKRIGEALSVDPSLVSHVIAGRRWQGKQGRRVMAYIAGIIGQSVTDVFPGSDRRKRGGKSSKPDLHAAAA